MATPTPTPEATRPAAVAGFEPDEWDRREDSPYLHRGRRKTYGDLRDHVMAGLGGWAGLEAEDGFEYCIWEVGRAGRCPCLWVDDPIPEYRWGVAWAVTGGSEGHYIHVQLILSRDDPGQCERHAVDLATLKTFGGWDAAHALAGRISQLLGA